jgi:hypothetical protein
MKQLDAEIIGVLMNVLHDVSRAAAAKSAFVLSSDDCNAAWGYFADEVAWGKSL